MYIIKEFIEAEKTALELEQNWDWLTEDERKKYVHQIALVIGMGTLKLGNKVQAGELAESRE